MPRSKQPEPRVPPQDGEAEEHVLGAMLINKAAVATAGGMLCAEDFYRRSNGLVFDACLALDAASEPVDAVTVVAKLEELGALEQVGGRSRVHELAALVPASANVGHYCKIVRGHALRRRLIAAGQEIAERGYSGEGEAVDVLDRAEGLILAAQNGHAQHGGLSHIADALVTTWQTAVDALESGQEYPGLSTGLRDLDRTLCGLEPGLTVIGARPSMGKTALELKLFVHVALELGLPAAMFTLEMSKAEIARRVKGLAAHVEPAHIRRSRSLSDAEWSRLASAADRLQKAPFYIDPRGSLSMAELRSAARALKAREPTLALILIDYLQLLAESGAENRNLEVGAWTRALKLLAADLDVPVVVASQLSRAVEQRHDKRPTLSDLRDSGEIEAHADNVLLLYRDDYYNPKTSGDPGTAEIMVAKARNGATGMTRVAFLRDYVLFSDLTAGS